MYREYRFSLKNCFGLCFSGMFLPKSAHLQFALPSVAGSILSSIDKRDRRGIVSAEPSLEGFLQEHSFNYV